MNAAAGRALAWLALLLAVSGGAQALELALDLGAVPAGAQPRAREVAAQALAALPPAWRAAPDRLPLRFDPGLPTAVAGRHRRGQLTLSPRLLEAPAPAGRPDPAVAALLHEIAHALDRRSDGRWSAQRSFRRLAGFDRGGNDNRYRLRSPDDYERHSPAESFAVNLEWYLLDPQYRCRRPALAQWFAGQLGPAPLPAAGCGTGLPVLAAGNRPGTLALESIDPQRVYAVDYLLADSGGPPMSRFGHSMLRLVICAPGRAPGPRCRMDLAEHRVLSFRAFVDDVQLSSWRGLTGGYASRLFVLPLGQVIDEYTRIELRDLHAWPIALERSQINALLQAAVRTHWSYDGHYRFIGNNCAVETGRLLDLALDPQRGDHYRRTTPRGVLRALRADGLASAGPAAGQGDHFPSARAEYRQLLRVLQQAGLVGDVSLERWLDSSAAARGQIPEDITLQPAAAWLVLETAALRRAELRAADQLKRQWSQPGDDMAALQARAQQWSGHLNALAAPATVVDGAGYGLPQASELAGLPQRLAGAGQTAAGLWDSLQAAGEQALPAGARQQLAQARTRVAWLGARVRQLAAAADAG